MRVQCTASLPLHVARYHSYAPVQLTLSALLLLRSLVTPLYGATALALLVLRSQLNLSQALHTAVGRCYNNAGAVADQELAVGRCAPQLS